MKAVDYLLAIRPLATVKEQGRKMKFSRDQGNTVPPLEVAQASKDWLLIFNNSFTKRKSSEIKRSIDFDCHIT